jgi:hypothetical protein
MYSYTKGSTLSGSRHEPSCITIRLPESMPAGAVIGNGGSNIKMLQQRSGDKHSGRACTGYSSLF